MQSNRGTREDSLALPAAPKLDEGYVFNVLGFFLASDWLAVLVYNMGTYNMFSSCAGICLGIRVSFGTLESSSSAAFCPWLLSSVIWHL